MISTRASLAIAVVVCCTCGAVSCRAPSSAPAVSAAPDSEAAGAGAKLEDFKPPAQARAGESWLGEGYCAGLHPAPTTDTYDEYSAAGRDFDDNCKTECETSCGSCRERCIDTRKRCESNCDSDSCKQSCVAIAESCHGACKSSVETCRAAICTKLTRQMRIALNPGWEKNGCDARCNARAQCLAPLQAKGPPCEAATNPKVAACDEQCVKQFGVAACTKDEALCRKATACSDACRGPANCAVAACEEKFNPGVNACQDRCKLSGLRACPSNPDSAACKQSVACYNACKGAKYCDKFACEASSAAP